MPTVDVVDLNNQKVGEVELADAVFGADVNEALFYEAVRHYQAGLRARHAQDQDAQRSGRLAARSSGSRRARAARAWVRSGRPIWRHGGTVHGPQPRDYSYKLPRKMLLGALRSALSAKLRDGELKVVQAFTFCRSQDEDRQSSALDTLEAAPQRCWWWITARTAT